MPGPGGCTALLIINFLLKSSDGENSSDRHFLHLCTTACIPLNVLDISMLFLLSNMYSKIERAYNIKFKTRNFQEKEDDVEEEKRVWWDVFQ